MNTPVSILYVDDSPFDRDLVRDSLEKEHGGFIFTEASSRKEFEKLLTTGTYDIVLSDFNILGFEGLQVLDTVHGQNPDIPVILVTGKGSEEVAVEAMKRGAADYVIKQPKHIQRLPAMIHTVLENNRIEKERDRLETTLHNNELRLRNLYETMSQGVVHQDKDGAITFVNPAAETILGQTIEEMRGRTSFDHRWNPIIEDGTPFPGESHPSMVALGTGRPVLDVIMGVFNPRMNEYRWITIDAFPQFHTGKSDPYQVYTVFEDITERKRAEEKQKHIEEELRKSEKRLRGILDNLQDAYFRADNNGRFTMVNLAATRMYGYSSIDEMMGLPAESLYADQDESRWVMDEIRKNGRVHDRIGLGQKKDGSTFWVSLNTQLYYDDKGEVQGTEAIIRDITDHKRAEEALKYEQNLLQALMDNIPDHIYFKDSASRFIRMNKAQVELFGFTDPAQIVNKTDFDFFTGEHAQSAYDDEQKIIQSGQSIVNKKEKETWPDGHVTWVSTTKMPLRDQDGRITGTFGISRDITEQKRLEDMREDERALLKTLIDNLPSSVFVKDREYKKTVVNSRHLKRMTETLRRPVPLSERDVLGKTDFEVYPKELAEVYNKEDQRVIENGETIINRELCSYGSGGQPLWEIISKIPLRDTTGNIVGMVGIANDITERKRFEEELQINETRYRLISNVVSDYVFSTKVEANGTLTSEWVAGAFEAMTGYTFEEFKSIGGWRAIVHPDDLMIDDRDIKTLRSNRQIETELRTIMKSGKIVWVRVYAHPVWDDQRNILVGIYGAVQNISEHIQVEKSLRDSEERYRSLYENSTVGIYRSTPDGKILLANPALLTMLGYSSFEELAERDLKKEGFDHSYNRTRFLELIEKTGDVKGLDSCWIKRDGTKVFLRENSRAIRDAWGKTLFYDGIVEDVTEQKRAEESLMRLNQAVAASGEVIFMTDRSGIITFTNAAFTRLYGYEPSEVIGKVTPRILKSGVQQHNKYAAFWRTLLNRQIVKSEWINRTKDGRLLNVEVTANPILDAQGKIIGFLSIQRDVTQQRNLEKEMHQAQKLESLGTLASGIAHDFNNILGIIMGHSTMISIARNDTQRVKSSIEAINKASERGASLVRQMLTFARKSDIDFTPLQVNDSIKEIEKLYHETFPKTMTLQCRLTEQLPLIVADSTQLHQVLLNLCVNARDAMNGNGTITISTGIMPGETLRVRFHNASFKRYVSIEVQDTGIGMDEATLQRIFDPFFTTKEIGKGTGLGLAVVFGIMESHEGFIDVQSKIGHGTTFSLYFPVKKSHSKSVDQEKEIQDISPPRGTETLLVVEDEELLRELLQISFEGNGYTVLTATNGEEAVDIYKENQQKIALVLSDLGLPIFNGREVLKKLMNINPAVKFIIASGYTDQGEKSEIFKDGAKEIVQKPYNMNDLLKKIRDVLDA